MKLLDVSKKLLLEKIYGIYVDDEIVGLKKMGEELYGLDKWKEFRLSVSGGSKSSMGNIGMGCISGFIKELELFDDIMSDWGGCYRGEFSWECRSGLFEILDNEIEDVVFRNEIKNEYNDYYKEIFED
jgi:hypothetical protein